MKPDYSEFANQLSAAGFEVARVDQDAIGVGMTPSFYSVDRNGIVVSYFLGSVVSPLFEKVADLLINKSETPWYRHITKHDITAMEERGDKYQMLDVEPSVAHTLTEARPLTRIQMSTQDLFVRGPYELDANLPVVVNCTGASPRTCQLSILAFHHLKFSSIFALDYANLEKSPACAL